MSVVSRRKASISILIRPPTAVTPSQPNSWVSTGLYNMNAAAKLRKRNKAFLNSREANLNGGSPPISPTKTNFAISAAPATTPALPQTSSFAKVAGDILTPDMTDIEKLQKLKDWILADQHPYFTSAPKVAHLLSLHVSASASNANSNTSGSSGEQERPLSSIPLAERLSYPKGASPAGQSHQTAFKDEDPSSRQREEVPDDVSMNDADLKEKNEDVEMSFRETTGPLLTPTHTEPPHTLAYSRPEDPERKSFNQTGNGRQSPRNEGRGYADNQSRGNGRYEPRGRHRGGGGYNNQGNRHFSVGDRETDQRFPNYGRDREYDRRPDYSVGHPDDRRNNPGSLGGSPPKQGRPSYDGRSGELVRARSDQTGQSLAIDPSAKSDEDMKSFTMDAHENTVDASELNASPPSADVKTEPPSASPTSIGGPPHSTTESTTTLPLASSPSRTETPLDAPPSRLGHDERPIANRTSPGTAGLRDIKPGRAGSRDRDHRPFNNRDADRYPPQDTRPRADSYHSKFPPASRPYERPFPPRDEPRSFSAREPYYQRPGYAPAPPVDERRFVPREAGYSDEPGYAPRRDYRAGDWDNKRRDIDRPLDRPYDRDRDRDVRAPLISPSDARGPRGLHVGTGPPRGYPPDRDGPRGLNPRAAHDPYPPHPPSLDSRGYDRDPYGAPPLPLVAPYLRETRVRPRSLSPPPRREYRPEARPPAKRPRGPDDPYVMQPPLPAGSHYQHSNYGPPSGRAQDYGGDRRSIPSGPAQGAYYRPDDRSQGRY